MATILNPTPPQTSAFGKVWITRLDVRFPSTGNAGRLRATFRPYDGSYLLDVPNAIPPLDVPDLADAATQSPGLAAMLAALEAELSRQFPGKAVTRLTVQAPNPAQPVIAIGNDPGTVILDCFAKCAADPVFASVFQTTLGTVAALAGLEIQQ